MKVCRNCKQEKSPEEFYKNKPAKDGLTSWCKICTNECARKYVDRDTNRVYQREWRAQNPDKVRTSRLRSYKLLPEQYNQMLIQQNHCCAICKSPSVNHRRGLLIDHNHATNVVRGLLCDPCNLMIGLAKEQISTLKGAIFYLETFS